MFVAVVMAKGNEKCAGMRPGAVTGATKDEAIQRALVINSLWCEGKCQLGRYRILVGELTEEVLTRQEYVLVTIQKDEE